MRKRLTVMAAALVLAVIALFPGVTSASQNQQDGYHFTEVCCVLAGGLPDTSGHWIDDDCGTQYQEFMVTLYNDTLGGVTYTRICHAEWNFACDNCVPSLKPWLPTYCAGQCGWQHYNLNDRVSAIHVNSTPAHRCIRVYKNTGGPTNNPFYQLMSSSTSSYGDYTAADHDFPNDWISMIDDVAC